MPRKPPSTPHSVHKSKATRGSAHQPKVFTKTEDLKKFFEDTRSRFSKSFIDQVVSIIGGDDVTIWDIDETTPNRVVISVSFRPGVLYRDDIVQRIGDALEKHRPPGFQLVVKANP